jgi:2-polyprenyl-3-methyl-5-hydroxy-6-metoxy-1,4-benzoquinol methylase
MAARGLTDRDGGSADRFGYEWAHYSEILPESRKQLERWLGSTGLASFKGKRILDVGCGMGRNPYWMAVAGAKSILCIDPDERCVALTRDNLKSFSGITVLQRSVYELTPDEVGVFDRVTCIGVLMILDAPAEALTKMWGCVAPGGDLVLWVYGKEGNSLVLPVVEVLRFAGSRMPLSLAHGLAKCLTIAGLPLLKVYPWRTEYYRHLSRLSRRNIESIVFDQMIPRHVAYWDREEIDELLSEIRCKRHIESVQGNSWHIRLTKAE